MCREGGRQHQEAVEGLVYERRGSGTREPGGEDQGMGSSGSELLSTGKTAVNCKTTSIKSSYNHLHLTFHERI